ncbi:MAG: hypothetical protein WD080_08785 [Egibacteraceae bacterium]
MTAPDRAEALVLGWARLYTRGVDGGARDRRLEELASDCFEQCRWGGEVGASPAAVATSMVARTLAGLPADLLWRQAQIATSRDRSPNPRGRPMRQWMKANWWLAIAGVLGAMLTVLGVMLPYEDRTVGAAVGGVVIAALGIGMLVGIRLRRRNRRLGSTLIAVGTLPTFPFFWTIVLPLLGLAVFIPALLDAADATAQGDVAARPTPPRRDAVMLTASGLLAAAIVAAIVIGTQTAAAALCAPPLALVIARAIQRRLPMPNRLARIGLTMFLTGMSHAGLLAVVTLAGDGTVDLGEPIALATGSVTSAVGVIGLVVWVAAMVTYRDRTSPA